MKKTLFTSLLSLLLFTSLSFAQYGPFVLFRGGDDVLLDYRGNAPIDKTFELDLDKIKHAGFSADAQPSAPLKFSFYAGNNPIIDIQNGTDVCGSVFEIQNIHKTTDGNYVGDLYIEFLRPGYIETLEMTAPAKENLTTTGNGWYKYHVKNVVLGKNKNLIFKVAGAGFASAQGSATLSIMKKTLKGTIGSFDNNDNSVSTVKPGDKVKIRWNANYE
jgi:hypothetical protein